MKAAAAVLFVLIIGFTFSNSFLIATQVTIGAGDQTARKPVDMYWKNSLFETMYYPDELGFAAGTITGIKFYNNFVTNLPSMPTKIWLGTTTQADLGPGWIPSTQMTLVYDGVVNYPSGSNTIDIVLTTPFMFSGSNLVMMVERPMDTQYYSSSDVFVTQTIGTNRARNAYSDTVDYDPAAPPTATATGAFPKTTFFFITQGMGALQGTVTSGGNPVQGATVTVANSTLTYTTGATGTYNFPYIAQGQQTVSATKHGYTVATQTVTIVENQTTTQNLAITLLPQVTVTGKIVGSDAPTVGIAGATIALSGYEPYTATTNATGNFTINNVFASQTYNYVANATGYQPATGTVVVGTTNVNMGNITVNEMAFPPFGVVAVETNNFTNVTLNWQAPNPGATGITEGFEGTAFPPTDWTQVITDTSAAGTTGVFPTWCHLGTVALTPPVPPHAGEKQTGMFWSYNHQDEWLKTPQFACPPSAVLNFWSYVFLGSTNADHYYVKVSTNNGSTWTPLWDASAQTGGWNYYATPITVDLSTYAGQQIIVAWQAVDGPTMDGLWYVWFLDDISIASPTGVMSFNNDQLISASQATSEKASVVYPTLPTSRALVSNPKLSEPTLTVANNDGDRTMLGYKVWRLLSLDQNNEDNWTLLTTDAITDTTLTDTGGDSMPYGVYKWAVKAVYTNNVLSTPAFSNELEKVDPAPRISVNPLSLEVSMGTSDSYQTDITITNIGHSELIWDGVLTLIRNSVSVGSTQQDGLNWKIKPHPDKPQLSDSSFSISSLNSRLLNVAINPINGNLIPGASMVCTLSITPADSILGDYAYELAINSNDPYTPALTIPIAVNYTLIPDENFRMAINEHLGQAPDYLPTIADLNGATGYLYAYDRNISNLQGAQHLVNLQSLHLGVNQISNITPLAGLTNLHELYLFNNQISNLSPLAGLTNLQLVILEGNQISDISPLAGLTNLQALNLGYNNISDISPLVGLANLQLLFLYGNQISDLSLFAGLPNLQQLSLFGNHISDLSPLAGLTNLQSLFLYDNQISDLSPLSGLVNLQVLYLFANQIIDLSPLSGLTNMIQLELSENQISDLTSLAGLINLQSLYLDANPISKESMLLTQSWGLPYTTTTYNAIAPCYPSPTREQLNINTGSGLQWAGNYSSETVIYEVWMGSSPQNLVYLGTATALADTLFGYQILFNPTTEYYWQIKAVSTNETVWGGMWHFTSAEPEFAGGNGTESDPYLVETATHLDNVRNHLEAHFLQTADIDLGVAPWNEGEGWVPIGVSFDFPFTGFYNGNNKVISNPFINRNQGYQGIWGSISGSEIKNLRIENANISSNSGAIGGLAGNAVYSILSNVSCNASVYGVRYVGGLLGISQQTTITNSSCAGIVHGSSISIGAIVGIIFNSPISDSYSSANVSGHSYVGGLVGTNDSSTLSNCYSTGLVTGNLNVGGLVGFSSGNAVNCYWNTETSGQTTSAAGEGRTTADMTYSYAANTYFSWDWANTWAGDIDHSVNSGYPYLQWQAPFPQYYPPQNLVAEPNASDIIISWQVPLSGNPSSYSLWHLLSGEEGNVANWVLVNSSLNTTTYTATGWNLLPDGSYKWAVKANYTEGQSLAIISNAVINPPDVIAEIADITLLMNGNINLPGVNTYFSSGAVNYSVAYNTHILWEVSIDNQMRIYPEANWFGSEYILIRGMDIYGHYAEQGVRVLVTQTYNYLEHCNYGGTMPAGFTQTHSGTTLWPWQALQDSGEDFSLQCSATISKTANERLLTQSFNLGSYRDVQISYDCDFLPSAGASASFAYSINNGATWNTYETLNTPYSGIKSFAIPALDRKTNVKLRWIYYCTTNNNGSANYWKLDNIGINGIFIDTTAPSQITGLQVSVWNNAGLTVVWNPSTETYFKEYRIYYSPDANVDGGDATWTVTNDPALNNANCNQTTLSGLAMDEYWLAIVAVDYANYVSPLSEVIHVVHDLQAPIFSAPFPMEQPNPGWSAITNPVIGCTILDELLNITSLYMRVDSNQNSVYDPEEAWNPVQLRSIGARVDYSFSFPHEFGGSGVYHFEFKVEDMAQNIAYSGMSGLEGINDDWIVRIDNMPPEQIGGLFSSAIGESTIQLVWNAIAEDNSFVGYEVYYATHSGVDDGDMLWDGNYDSSLFQIGNGIKSSTVSGLELGTRYYFRIRARDIAGNVSVFSDEISAITIGSAAPLPPQELMIAVLGEDVLLSWQAVSTDVNGQPVSIGHYEIHAALEADFIPNIDSLIDTSTTNSFVHTGVVPYLDKVFYRVIAVEGELTRKPVIRQMLLRK